jgi:hypothetical protein
MNGQSSVESRTTEICTTARVPSTQLDDRLLGTGINKRVDDDSFRVVSRHAPTFLMGFMIFGAAFGFLMDAMTMIRNLQDYVSMTMMVMMLMIRKMSFQSETCRRLLLVLLLCDVDGWLMVSSWCRALLAKCVESPNATSES